MWLGLIFLPEDGGTRTLARAIRPRIAKSAGADRHRRIRVLVAGNNADQFPCGPTAIALNTPTLHARAATYSAHRASRASPGETRP